MAEPVTRKAAPAFFSDEVDQARRFYLDLNPQATRRLAVVCGGLEHCARDYSITRSTFPFLSLEYVARGTGTLALRRRTHDLMPGRMFSYGPGVSHQIRGNPADPLVKYFVDFTGTAATRLSRACGLAPGSVVDIYPVQALQRLFDELIEAGVRDRKESQGLCEKVLECIMLRSAGARAPQEGTETLSFVTYEKCRQHIERHAQRLKSLSQVAEECHVNDAYLCRLFQRYDHQSPYQWLLRLKMNYAAERLQQAGILVKQVAEECGFTDVFHFSRVFRGVFAKPPTAFRRMR